MGFNRIDFGKYSRAEHYNHYTNGNPSTFSITADIDVSILLSKCRVEGKKFHPAMIFIVTRAVNEQEEMKMGVDADGNLGYYEYSSPAHLIFHDDDKTFSRCVTEFNGDIKAFYNNLLIDLQKYKDVKGFSVNSFSGEIFHISALPWLKYNAINLNIPYAPNFYAPIITWGKYDGKTLLMPFTAQVNHAVADGYHVSKLINRIQELCNEK